jgi:hypothetical protein
MNERLMSEQIDQLGTALAKAQVEFDIAEKNQKNPFFKSNYADLESVIKASRPALCKYGLSVVQSPFVGEDGNSYLITILIHSSGQWIKSKAKHNPAKTDVQSLSAYNTYLKRMCYSSLVGVSTGEIDDDGNAASQPQIYQNNNKPDNNQPGVLTTLKPQSIKPIEDMFPLEQDEIDFLKDLPLTTQQTIIAHYKVDSIEKLNLAQFNEVYDRVTSKKK